MQLEPEDDFASELLQWDFSIAGHHYQPDAGTAAQWHAARGGSWPEWFADGEIASGAAAWLNVERPWLLQLGNDIFKARNAKYTKSVANLQRLVRRLVKETGRGPHDRAATYYVHWVCSIRDELHRRAEGRSTGGQHAEIFGVVIEALNYMRARGIKPTFAALCAITRKLACASATDTQTAILHYSRDVPLADWLPPASACQSPPP
jgi:hypothetical protein